MDSSRSSSYSTCNSWGRVCEIYSGIQGEGLLVGERQIFIRLTGCNLNCVYCDTPHARILPLCCRIECTPGLRDFITVDNPVALKDVVAYTERLNNPLTLHHSVVLTGGEPLVQAEFASALASVLRQGGIRIFLETNGSLPDKLHLILPFVDYISMDIKLASSAGGPDLLETHKAFLQQALSANVYVKIVLTSDTSTEELLRAVRMVHSIDPAIPLVLQPATNCSGRFSPSAGQVLEWQKQCKAFLQNVRVIPQCHRIIGQL